MPIHLDAVPTLFEGLPTYWSSPQGQSRPSPSERKKTAVQRQECQQDKWFR